MVALLKMPSFLDDGAMAPSMSIADTSNERRMFERRESKLLASAKRLDHTIPARRTPTLQFMLRDLSIGGCSALTDVPLQTGEHLSVSIPQQGMIQPWSALARVIRCQPSPTGYRVAVEFDPLPAA
jgi:hypothetical protein